MPFGAMRAGLAYYRYQPHSTRYTDNYGVVVTPEAGIHTNTHEQIAAYLNKAHIGSKILFNADWVQYSAGSIKRAMAEIIPTALFDELTALVFPTPGYGVIKDPKNNRGAKIIDVPMYYDQPKKKWKIDYTAARAKLNAEGGICTQWFM
jgi:hypothetical protein